MRKIAIVAALEREVRPLIAGWPVCEREQAGRRFRFFEHNNAVLVCGGIGAEPARRAAEAIIELYAPAIVWSVGFAGALQPRLRVGDITIPRRVVDVRDGSSVDTAEGAGILVTSTGIVSPKEKAQLAASYDALAVDMEAAAVARGAQARGVRFAAVKVISDERDFSLPTMPRFISVDGKFETAGFVVFALLRPWLWPKLGHLAGNSKHAAQALSSHLERMIDESARGVAVSESARVRGIS